MADRAFRKTHMRYLILSFLIAVTAQAADILNISGQVMMVDFTAKRVELNVPAFRGVSAESRVCLQGKTETKQILDLKCGKILSVDQEKVLVEITKGGLSFKLGEFVTVLTENRAVGEERMLASYYDVSSGQLVARSGVGAGMTFGLNYFFPSVQLELAVSRVATLGITGVYGDSQSNNSRQKTGGGLLSLTFYLPQPTLGLNFELIGGYYSSTVFIGTLAENTNSLMGAALMGWKGFMGRDFHYKVSAGAQYVSNQTEAKYLDFNNVLPFFRAQIGVSF
jgi:hypothetical protein